MRIVESPHHDRRKAKHRAHGKVELAGDHQKGHAQSDHPQLRGECQEIADVAQLRGTLAIVAVKATIPTTSRTNGPNSGLATSLWRSEIGAAQLPFARTLHDLEIVRGLVLFVQRPDADVESRRNAAGRHRCH